MSRRKKWDDIMKEVRQAVGAGGWFIISVMSDGREPGFAYTVGLSESFGHPELIVYGLPQEVAHSILNSTCKMIKEGRKFATGDLEKGLANLPLAFGAVDESQLEGRLNVAIRYYGRKKFSAVQLIWPDEQGKFPWQDGYDRKHLADQPLLQKHS